MSVMPGERDTPFAALLFHQAPIPLALAHQVLAIVVLSIAVVHAERLSPSIGVLRATAKPGGAGI